MKLAEVVLDHEEPAGQDVVSGTPELLVQNTDYTIVDNMDDFEADVAPPDRDRGNPVETASAGRDAKEQTDKPEASDLQPSRDIDKSAASGNSVRPPQPAVKLAGKVSLGEIDVVADDKPATEENKPAKAEVHESEAEHDGRDATQKSVRQRAASAPAQIDAPTGSGTTPASSGTGQGGGRNRGDSTVFDEPEEGSDGRGGGNKPDTSSEPREVNVQPTDADTPAEEKAITVTDRPKYPSVPFGRRTTEDVINREDERHLRGEIDRPVREPNTLFSTIANYADGTARSVRPGERPENTPSYIAAEVAKATGRVAIADIGCGTGNTLVTWGRKVAEEAKVGIEAVTMTGLSRQDYRGESMSRSTNRAIREPNPQIRYIVGNAHDMHEIDSGSQDVVLAYNSLIYATQPDIWLSEMARIAKPGGTLLFNTTFTQGSEGTPLTRMVAHLSDMGYRFIKNNLILPKTARRRVFVTTHYQTMNNTSLYRIDVPSAEETARLFGRKL